MRDERRRGEHDRKGSVDRELAFDEIPHAPPQTLLDNSHLQGLKLASCGQLSVLGSSGSTHLPCCASKKAIASRRIAKSFLSEVVKLAKNVMRDAQRRAFVLADQ